MKRSPMPRRYRDTGPDWDTVMLVLTRHGFRCARCDGPIQGERGFDWSMQHRLPRGSGGTSLPDINSPANLIPLDGHGTSGCNGYVESHRTESYDKGWLVRHGFNPLLEPVLIEHESRWVYLDHVGGMSDNPPEAVAS